jgi:DNA-directed RNA polymerase subunit RPC12/RpoP
MEADEVWERVRALARRHLADGSPIFTLKDRVHNIIVEVGQDSIARVSERGQSNQHRVTRKEVTRLWAELHGGPKADVLSFTRALVAHSLPGLVVVTKEGDLRLEPRPSRAWLMLATGDDRQHAGNEGYDDDPASHYSWDSTVANHAKPAVDDVIVLRDKTMLLGASVIERIDEEDTTKTRRRCPRCKKTGFKERTSKTPRFRCPDCKHRFHQPVEEEIAVHTYRSHHEPAWVDLQGRLDAAALRELCLKPDSIQSLRELDWGRFRAQISEVDTFDSVRVIERVRGEIAGGYRTAITRVRIGQDRFRTVLKEQFGSVCALTGPHPFPTLDAAHLYSFAEHGMHDQHGGLLLRKDIHRLFDLGLIAIHPDRLTIDVHPDLLSVETYARLQGKHLPVQLPDRAWTWIRAHWSRYRARI